MSTAKQKRLDLDALLSKFIEVIEEATKADPNLERRIDADNEKMLKASKPKAGKK